MKKELSLLMAGLLAANLLAGCSAGKTPAANADTPGTTQSAPALSLKSTEITLTSAGYSYELYDGTVNRADVVFASDDESVATFADGFVTAIGDGDTTVHASYGGVRLTCRVKCTIPKETVPVTEAPTTEPAPETTAPTTVPETTAPKATEPEIPVNTGGSRDPVKLPPSAAKVDSSFFDDAVFIGDSVSLKLSYYANSTGALGKAQFLVRGSYSMAHAWGDTMLLPYQGKEYKIQDAVQATGAKKVFMMMGMNDIGPYSIEDTVSRWDTVIGRIKDRCPGVQIYIQSATPIYTGAEVGDLTNPRMDTLNEKLRDYAASHGCQYVDVASYMKDSTNGLAAPYCSDEYVHVTDAGAAAWIKVLKASVS